MNFPGFGGGDLAGAARTGMLRGMGLPLANRPEGVAPADWFRSQQDSNSVAPGVPKLSASLPIARQSPGARMQPETLMGLFPSFRRGGLVRREGLYHLHRGERVLNLAKAIQYRKEKKNAAGQR